MRAHRHAHTDFARSFSHAHQHDVHDSDSADHERHTCDCTEQYRHHSRGGRGSFGDFLLSAHSEIVIATGPNVMPLSQQRNNFMLRKVVPPITRFIALVYGMTTMSS